MQCGDGWMDGWMDGFTCIHVYMRTRIGDMNYRTTFKQDDAPATKKKVGNMKLRRSSLQKTSDVDLILEEGSGESAIPDDLDDSSGSSDDEKKKWYYRLVSHRTIRMILIT